MLALLATEERLRLLKRRSNPPERGDERERSRGRKVPAGDQPRTAPVLRSSARQTRAARSTRSTRLSSGRVFGPEEREPVSALIEPIGLNCVVKFGEYVSPSRQLRKPNAIIPGELEGDPQRRVTTEISKPDLIFGHEVWQSAAIHHCVHAGDFVLLPVGAENLVHRTTIHDSTGAVPSGSDRRACRG